MRLLCRVYNAFLKVLDDSGGFIHPGCVALLIHDQVSAYAAGFGVIEKGNARKQ